MRQPPPPPPPTAKTLMVPASPGRADKLPAPGLARLLRGKGGSRSRSRSRSSLSRASPLFASRSRSVGRASAPPVDAGENGEPSSPKVTCIGQVRIRKKGKKNSGSARQDYNGGNQHGEKRKIRCRCLDLIPRRRRASAGGGGGGGVNHRWMWRGWPIGLRFEGNARHRQRMEPIDADPALTPPPAALSSSVWGDWGKPIAAECEREDADRTDVPGEAEEHESGESEEEETRVFVSSSSTPPKNALILMRCRSAPHNRSSALSIRFPASPVPASGEGHRGDDNPCEENKGDGREAASNGSGSNASAGGVMEEEEEDEEEEARCPSSRPLFLKRCKSEPARMAAPEAANCSKNSGEELTVILKD